MRPLKLAAALVLGLSAVAAHTKDAASVADLVFEGIELHDRGDYAGAVAKYRTALEISPKDATAQYELALTLTAQRKYDEAITVAERGSAQKSPLQPVFLDLYGNLLDNKGKSNEAMRAYQRGLKLDPDLAPLHYDLGITAIKQRKPGLALEHLKRNIELRPAHPAGHYALAGVWDEQGYPMPALFAYMRFLSVAEDHSAPGRQAAQRMRDLLQAGVSKGNDKHDEKHVEIFVDPNPRQGEGDFAALQLLLTVASAAPPDEGHFAQNESARIAAVIATAVAFFVESLDDKLKQTYVYRNYRDFVGGLRKQHVDAFAYVALAQCDTPGAGEWVSAHSAEVSAYREWVKSMGVEAPAVKL